MRIERVDLRPFGHFADTTVELHHPVGGLRFVVGPNEAGKSTVRSALLAGLFGFAGRAVAGRPAAASTVTLHLRNGEGDELVLLRRGSGAPRDASGRTIDDEELARWVSVGREAFDRLYCLGHDELRRYGQALLQSGEDLGRIAFGAALGGTHVQKIGTELESQLEALYTPSGRAKTLHKAIAELTSLDAQLRSMTVTADAWQALRAQIQEHESRLTRLRTRDAALVRETARLQRIRRTANARNRLRDHREELERLRAEGPTPDPGAATRIASLLQDRESSTGTITQLETSVGTLEGRLETIGTERAALERTSEITALHQEVGGYREAVERLRQHALSAATARALPEAERLMAVLADQAGVRPQVDALSDLDAEIAGQRAALDAKKAELGLSGVQDDGVAGLAVPSEAEIEAARDGAAERAATRKKLLEALEEVERDLAGAEERLQELEAGGVPLPSPAEIAAARSERDGSWGVLRQWFVSDAPPADGRRDRGELADQVEEGIEHADELVDRVRADTDRAAKIQSVDVQLGTLRARRTRHEEQLAELEGQQREALDAWRALWAEVAVSVGSPAEMREWRHGWRQLCQDLAAFSSAIARADQRRRALDEVSERLRDALDASGHAPPVDAGVLAMVDIAQQLVEAEAERREDEREAAVAKARIAQLDTQLAALLPLLAPEDRSPGDRAIEKLHERRNQQARDHEARSTLAEQITDANRALEGERETLERLEAKLRDEAQALGVSVDRLPEVVARAQTVAELEGRIDERIEQLLDAGDGLDIQALHDEAEEFRDTDTITARLEAIVHEREQFELDRKEVTRRLVELEHEFAAIAGGDEVAAAHEAQARALSRIEDLLEEIAVLTLATSLLDRVVDAARATGRGPLIERASHYFGLLTGSAFDGLDLESHGEEAFPVAVRADGARLYPNALSDGTLDQLWLAWRLAGVEHHLDQTGPVPLIVDDVLVNFDDARAGSAFRALASLAKRTQVLVLTHHPHLVDIARERIGEDRVVVAHLAPRPEGALSVTQVVSAAQALGRSPVPPATAPSRPAARASSAPTAPVDTALEALRVAIDGEWRGKAELITRSGIASNAWNAAIKALLAESSVEQQGAKRGAKYRRLVANGEGPGA